MHHLRVMIRDLNPDVVFISKTKISSQKANGITASMGFANLEVVSSFGLSGGLAVFWRNGVGLESVISNKNLISGIILSNPSHT